MKAPARKVVFTGGGTAGHVFPNLPLIAELEAKGYRILYIGGKGMERELLRGRGFAYRAVATGKLRRYFSLRNFLDLFKVAGGLVQSVFILAAFRPGVVFSKGGFVSVPVCIAARLLGIPVLAHESDLTPGLATRIVARFAKVVFCAFPATGSHLPGRDVRPVGIPLRPSLAAGDRQAGLKLCGFAADPADDRPVLLVMGGSLGAQALNQAVESAWPELRHRWRIVHLTGAGKRTAIEGQGYRQFEFLDAGLSDVLAASDAVLARAGATSLFEFLSLRKPMVLVPLEAGSRGDQVLNAGYFQQRGFAAVVREKELTAERLVEALETAWQGRARTVQAMSAASARQNATEAIVAQIEALA